MLLAGCGSDGESERLSSDELVDRVNEVCAEHLGEINRLEQDLGGGDEDRPSLDDFARIFPQIADEFRELADDLSALSPPEDLDEQYELTLDRIDRVADQFDRAAEEARDGSRERFNAVLQETAAADATERFFRENGFEDCI
jgi:acyl-CoA reductase-like NAD-dependent aldehyde dehydrogenase